MTAQEPATIGAAGLCNKGNGLAGKAKGMMQDSRAAGSTSVRKYPYRQPTS